MGIFSKLFGTKDSALKGACICMIDIDSDSYELIIASLDVYKKISAIAKTTDIPLLLYRRSYQWQKFR